MKLGARLIDSFHRTTDSKASMPELLDLVDNLRGSNPAAMFVAQDGAFLRINPPKSIVREEGAQLWVIALKGEKYNKFCPEMIVLGKQMRDLFNQE